MIEVNAVISEHIRVIETVRSLNNSIVLIAKLCANSLANGNKILFCGNGGSASDSQHLAGELVGRLKGNRRSLAAMALCADSAVMSCIANDYGYEQVYARQVEGLAKSGDILFGISTSGNSQNVVLAVEAANAMGVHSVGLLGGSGGKLLNLCQQNICISESTDTARIQEAHILIGHCICALIEQELGLVG